MAKANILLVDDEANILEALRGILTDEGYGVTAADNGDDALRLLQENAFDLVLLDIWLPGRRDGLQTLREIRRRGYAAEVIMMSGHGSIDTAVRATKMGAYDFIEKPLSLAPLLETVEGALAASRERAGAVRRELPKFIAVCPEMRGVLERLGRAAGSPAPIMLEGEPGAGKEYGARYIHASGSRAQEPFIKVACRFISPSGFDGLFGPAGENPLAGDSPFLKLTGTVYLDNPALLPMTMQHRLATLALAGTERGIRFIAGVPTAPGGAKPDGLTSELADLFADNAIVLPPLRQREGDIAEFINHFMHDAREDFGKTGLRISPRAMDRLLAYSWPGNVKELATVVENMVIATTGPLIEPKDIPFGGPTVGGPAAPAAPAPIARGTPQKTIAKSVVITGVGLHSGIRTGAILSPLPPNSGVIFADISSGRQVRADIGFVESTEYATTLKSGAVAVRTIEHLMATLHLYGIANILIKVGDEVPILDGSAVELCKLIEDAGVVEQSAPVAPFRPTETVVIGERGEGKKFIVAEPADILTVEYRMDYPPPIGRQSARYNGGGVDGFKAEIAPARTFGFVETMKKLAGRRGFAEGGRLNNVILLDNERVVNTALRFDNEFSRHKVLDLLGDVYLFGRPVLANITANMTGHTENVLLVRRLRELAAENAHG